MYVHTYMYVDMLCGDLQSALHCLSFLCAQANGSYGFGKGYVMCGMSMHNSL